MLPLFATGFAKQKFCQSSAPFQRCLQAGILGTFFLVIWMLQHIGSAEYLRNHRTSPFLGWLALHCQFELSLKAPAWNLLASSSDMTLPSIVLGVNTSRTRIIQDGTRITLQIVNLKYSKMGEGSSSWNPHHWVARGSTIVHSLVKCDGMLEISWQFWVSNLFGSLWTKCSIALMNTVLMKSFGRHANSIQRSNKLPLFKIIPSACFFAASFAACKSLDLVKKHEKTRAWSWS